MVNVAPFSINTFPVSVYGLPELVHAMLVFMVPISSESAWTFSAYRSPMRISAVIRIAHASFRKFFYPNTHC